MIAPRVRSHGTDLTTRKLQTAARVQEAYGFGRVMEVLRQAKPVIVGHNFIFDSGHLVKLGTGA